MADAADFTMELKFKREFPEDFRITTFEMNGVKIDEFVVSAPTTDESAQMQLGWARHPIEKMTVDGILNPIVHTHYNPIYVQGAGKEEARERVKEKFVAHYKMILPGWQS